MIINNGSETECSDVIGGHFVRADSYSKTMSLNNDQVS